MQISGKMQQYQMSLNAGNATEVSEGIHAQKTDVLTSQLIPGKIVEGTILQNENGQVQLGLSNGETLLARLQADIELSQGESLFFQVKSNEGNKIQITPYMQGDKLGNPTLMQALKAANLSVTAQHVEMVDAMMQEQMGIDKQSLGEMARLMAKNPEIPPQTLVQMNKLGVPLTEENAIQFQNYQQENHSLLKQMDTVFYHLPRILATAQENVADVMQMNQKIASMLAEGAEQILQEPPKQPTSANETQPTEESMSRESTQITQEDGTSVQKQPQTLQNDVQANTQTLQNDVQTNTQSVQKNEIPQIRAQRNEAELNLPNQQSQALSETLTDLSLQNQQTQKLEGNVSSQQQPQKAVVETSTSAEKTIGVSKEGENRTIQNAPQMAQKTETTLLETQTVNDKQAPTTPQEQSVPQSQTASNTINAETKTTGSAPSTTEAQIAEKTELEGNVKAQSIVKQPITDSMAATKASDIQQHTQQKLQINAISEAGKANEFVQRAHFLLQQTTQYSKQEQISEVHSFFSDLQKALSESQQHPKEWKTLFQNKEYQKLVQQSMEAQWTVTPKDTASKEVVSNLYERLNNQLHELEQILQSTTKQAELAKTSVSNMEQNLEFMSQVNQIYQYVQLPLKLSGQNAHADLYVYTNRRSNRGENEPLSAFLHLDLEALGSTDISIQMQKKDVNVRFYLSDEKSFELLAAHEDDLKTILAKKGYRCTIKMENEEKHINLTKDFLHTGKSPNMGCVHRYSFDVMA